MKIFSSCKFLFTLKLNLYDKNNLRNYGLLNGSETAKRGQNEDI